MFAEDQVDLALEERGRPTLVPGRLRRAQRAGAAADLGLVAAEEQELRTDPRGDLRGRLQRDVLERRLVGVAVQREQRALGAAERSPRPPFVAQHRPAEIEADVGEILHPVALAALAGQLRELVGQIGALQPFAGAVDVRRAARPVRAGLELHVQLHAGGRVGRRRAAGRDAHLLEHVEVVVGRRAAGGREIGHRDAVEVPGVLREPRALRDVVRLLAGFSAADVDAIDHHAGDGLQDDPRIARRRQLLQLLVRHAGRHASAGPDRRSALRDSPARSR